MKRLSKTIKQNIMVYIICIGLFFLAGVLQYVDNDLTIFWDKLGSLVVNLIFFLLIFIWGISVKNRIIKKSTRKLLIIIAVLIFMWLFIRYVKYYFFESSETISRYLWYLYYIPQCLVPPLAWISAMELIRKNNKEVSKYTYLSLVPAFILIMLILTNDLHQTAFVFKENFANFQSDYTHGVVYYITMAWLIVCIIASVATLFFKCSISASRKKIWIPITVFVVCVTVSALCFVFDVRSYKVPELISFSFIAIFESCVWIRLIPSNLNYEKYFKILSVPSVITDETLKPVFYTANLLKVKRNFLKKAKTEKEILLNKNTRLSCKKISGGYVFYAENLLPINKLLGKLSIANEELKEVGELIVYENELQEKKVKTEQQSQLYNKMFKIASDSLKDINILIEDIDENSENYQKNLHLACVYLAYIKRRGNLEMIANKNQKIDINEIELSLKESLNCLSDCGITTSLIVQASGCYDANICILLYEFFEICIKKAMPSLSSLIIKLSSKNNEISLRAITTNAAQSAKKFLNNEIKKLNGKITVFKEEECLYQTLTFKMGGDK